MPRRRIHQVGDQVVTAADIRQWMQSVGSRISPLRFHEYVRDFGVVEKIARAKSAGEFKTIVDQASRDAGVKVRAARKPGVLTRVRLLPAANEPAFTAACAC